MPTSNQLSHSAKAFLSAARIGHLATSTTDGRPHLVPVCFAYENGQIFIALDAKPKKVPATSLKRVRNIIENPNVTFLVDKYSENWSNLAYVLVTGVAALQTVGSSGHTSAVRVLRAKYSQYSEMPIELEPVIAISPTGFSEWQATPGETIAGEQVAWRDLDFESLVRGRHVVRRFKQEHIPHHLVRRVLEAARWAPSPHGAQPWRFVVVRGTEKKKVLAEEMAREWRGTLEKEGVEPEVVNARVTASTGRILSTPVAMIACLYLEDLARYPDAERSDAERTMAIQSLGAAIQNLLLAAYNLGLDTGWMCAPLFVPETVQKALQIPPSFIPHALIQLGYGAVDPPRREKRPLDDLALWLD